MDPCAPLPNRCLLIDRSNRRLYISLLQTKNLCDRYLTLKQCAPTVLPSSFIFSVFCWGFPIFLMQPHGWLAARVHPPGGWCSPRTDRAEPPTARGSVENDGGNQHSISLLPARVHCGARARPILSAFDADLLNSWVDPRASSVAFRATRALWAVSITARMRARDKRNRMHTRDRSWPPWMSTPRRLYATYRLMTDLADNHLTTSRPPAAASRDRLAGRVSQAMFVLFASIDRDGKGLLVSRSSGCVSQVHPLAPGVRLRLGSWISAVYLPRSKGRQGVLWFYIKVVIWTSPSTNCLYLQESKWER
jgi:hypothetical protein